MGSALRQHLEMLPATQQFSPAWLKLRLAAVVGLMGSALRQHLDVLLAAQQSWPAWLRLRLAAEIGLMASAPVHDLRLLLLPVLRLGAQETLRPFACGPFDQDLQARAWHDFSSLARRAKQG